MIKRDILLKATPVYIAVDEDGNRGYGDTPEEAQHDLAPCEGDASHVVEYRLHIPLPTPAAPLDDESEDDLLAGLEKAK